MEKGFEEKEKEGKSIFVKGRVAIVYTTNWQPCDFESGMPLSTQMHIDTWEELEKLMQEGGIK